MTVLATFNVTVLYAQILVFAPSTPLPGLLWTDEHVAQGFAWSEGSVSFGIPDHDGDCLVRISLSPRYVLPENALWAVKVPFTVSHAAVQAGSILSDIRVDIPNGTYELFFTALPNQDPDMAFTLSFDFVASPDPDFAILKRGGELETDKVLTRDAEFAS